MSTDLLTNPYAVSQLNESVGPHPAAAEQTSGLFLVQGACLLIASLYQIGWLLFLMVVVTAWINGSLIPDLTIRIAVVSVLALGNLCCALFILGVSQLRRKRILAGFAGLSFTSIALYLMITSA